MSDTTLKVFQPLQAGTQNGVITTSPTAFTVPKGIENFVLTNVGTAVVFVRVNPPNVTTAASATTDMPVLPNTAAKFSMDLDAESVSVVGATMGSTVYVTRGRGS